MLSPYQVLDLSDERGLFAGYILASLGAEVIAVEPPQGSSARRVGPYAAGPEGDVSLTFAAYARGKRSLAIDLASPSGREELLRLAAGADVLIESATPGEMARLGLAYADLAAINPALIYTSISAFGQTGPKATWPATDLTVLASSCALVLNGDADRPPVRVLFPQAFAIAAAVAAGATITALLERANSGLGQHVDVAAQTASMLAVQLSVVAAAIGSATLTRSSGGARIGAMQLRFVYPTADDGHVSITHVFGAAIGPATARLMAWAHELGLCSAEIAGKDWVNFGLDIDAGRETIETWEEAKLAVERLTSSHTKAELLAEAMKRRLLMAPIATMEDVAASEQLAKRDFFDEIPHPTNSAELIAAPGHFVKTSKPGRRRIGAAPALDELRGHLAAQPARRPAMSASPTLERTAGSRPLDGLKVLDFTWSIAGPHIARTLADCGATIVKIESTQKPDATRGYRPTYDDRPGPEDSALFDSMNAGKKSLRLDLNHPDARAVIVDLVRWADVVTESFSPRAMRGWKLGYEDLRAYKPDLIMLSTCLAGQDGPLAEFAGYGNLGAALSGFYGLAGWPDRPPAGPFGAYTDYTSTHLLHATVLAALDHRRRTGEGQYLDGSQAEAALHYLAPALLEYTATGRIPRRDGNNDVDLCPHGVYPAAGEDRWLAVACQDDAHWPPLARLIGRDDLARDPLLATGVGRRQCQNEIDAALAAWTACRPEADGEALLLGAGVAAHVVQNSPECLADPQLAHRGHFIELDHPQRRSFVESTRFRLSATPPTVGLPPHVGQHTDEVLREILSYSAEKIAALTAVELFR